MLRLILAGGENENEGVYDMNENWDHTYPNIEIMFSKFQKINFSEILLKSLESLQSYSQGNHVTS